MIFTILILKLFFFLYVIWFMFYFITIRNKIFEPVEAINASKFKPEFLEHSSLSLT